MHDVETACVDSLYFLHNNKWRLQGSQNWESSRVKEGIFCFKQWRFINNLINICLAYTFVYHRCPFRIKAAITFIDDINEFTNLTHSEIEAGSSWTEPSQGVYERGKRLIKGLVEKYFIYSNLFLDTLFRVSASTKEFKDNCKDYTSSGISFPIQYL